MKTDYNSAVMETRGDFSISSSAYMALSHVTPPSLTTTPSPARHTAGHTRPDNNPEAWAGRRGHTEGHETPAQRQQMALALRDERDILSLSEVQKCHVARVYS